MKTIEFKVIRTNKHGHRFILEPNARKKFRERCKYNRHYTICDKRYGCHVDGGYLIGCSENVDCPRVHQWDKRHGLEKPYTMVERKYPDVKPTTFTWHPAVESPGKRRVLMAFIVKGHEKGHYVFSDVRFLSSNVVPANCSFKNADGVKRLPVAWAYYDEVIKNIAPWMAARAEGEAWPWWPDKEETNKEK